MTTMGCCGYGPRRVSIAGLLADADFHPANTPQGRRARARLAYSVAAAQAARTNNPSAYRRALSGLANLGDEITSTDSSAAAQGINGALQRLGTNASFRNSLSQASAYIGLALNAASLGTGIAATACNGCDRTGIDVVNNVISWIRALMNGSVPSVSGLTPEQLNGFVDFCAVKDQIKGAAQIAFTAASAAANAAAAGGTAGAAQAATALDTIQSFIGSFLDSICQIPQVQTAIANRAAAAAAPPPPPAQPAQPATLSTRCWDGSTQTAVWSPSTGRWNYTRVCPPCTPAKELRPIDIGPCGARGPGAYSPLPPNGMRLSPTLVAPRTSSNCSRCCGPNVIFTPGVPNAAGDAWITPPRCRTAGAGGAGGGSGSGSGGSSSSGAGFVIPAAAAAALWFLL